MQVSKESLEELKAILTKDYGRDFTDAEVADAARRLLTFYEGYVTWLGKQPVELDKVDEQK